jgi:hypothetical protein
MWIDLEIALTWSLEERRKGLTETTKTAVKTEAIEGQFASLWDRFP